MPGKYRGKRCPCKGSWDRAASGTYGWVRQSLLTLYEGKKQTKKHPIVLTDLMVFLCFCRFKSQTFSGWLWVFLGFWAMQAFCLEQAEICACPCNSGAAFIGIRKPESLSSSSPPCLFTSPCHIMHALRNNNHVHAPEIYHMWQITLFFYFILYLCLHVCSI